MVARSSFQRVSCFISRFNFLLLLLLFRLGCVKPGGDFGNGMKFAKMATEAVEIVQIERFLIIFLGMRLRKMVNTASPFRW